jgi:hypothetical protein
MFEARLEPDPPKQFRGSSASLGRAPPRNAHRHFGILEGAELRQQVMELKDKPDVPIPKRHHLGIRQGRQRRRINPDGPLVN